MYAQKSNAETTTYYLIRHAEKIRTDSLNKNPFLSDKGKARAQNWSTVFEHVNFDLIYTTNYNRTIQTAEPTAKKQKLTIQFYNAKDLYSKSFQEQTKGKTVLVVGHSNTTPQFVNAILKEEKYPEIEDDNNANLYIVTISNNFKKGILIKVPFKE